MFPNPGQDQEKRQDSNCQPDSLEEPDGEGIGPAEPDRSSVEVINCRRLIIPAIAVHQAAITDHLSTVGKGSAIGGHTFITGVYTDLDDEIGKDQSEQDKDDQYDRFSRFSHLEFIWKGLPGCPVFQDKVSVKNYTLAGQSG